MHAPQPPPCSDGKTPLKLAIEANKPDVVALLQLVISTAPPSRRSIIHAAEDGDVARLRNLLNTDASLVHERDR